MQAGLKKRLSTLEQRLTPPQPRVTMIGRMPGHEFLARISSSECEEFKSALLSLRDGDNAKAREVVRHIISLGQERKDQGLICISEAKPADEYNAELHEARLAYGSEAWRYVSYRSEYWVEEVD